MSTKVIADVGEHRSLQTVRPQDRSRLEWLIPAILCSIMFGQLFFSSRQISQTADEATHLYSGYRYLKCGDLTISPEHPPLAKIVAALPLLSMNLQVDCTPSQSSDDVAQAFESLHWFYSQKWQSELFRARMAVSIFALGLCVLVWIVARRMFGFGVAVMATLLVVFEPNVLANGTLVMTDMAVTAMLLFAVFAFYLWSRQPSAPLLILAGLTAGLTLLSKTSGILLIPILIVLAMAEAFLPRDDKRPPRRLMIRNLMAVGMISAVAFAVIWMGYAMRYAEHTGPALPQDAPTLTSSSTLGRVSLALEENHLLPQGYLAGFTFLEGRSNETVRVFILGRYYPHAQWYFFPLNFLIRSTAAFLTMLLLSLVGIVLSFKDHRREVLFLVIPPTIFLAACMCSSVNSGIRHLLPMLSFVLIAVAAGCMQLAKRSRWINYAVPCLLVLHAASSLHAFPNYLSYANEFWGGSTQTYKYLPWIDIGQSYLQVRDYTERHPSEDCWLFTNWQWDPAAYDLHCKPVGYWQMKQIPPRLRGTVIVSSTMFSTIYAEQSILVEPFKNTTPTDYIGGGAMLVFKGDFDTRVAASVSVSQLARDAIQEARYNDGLELADYAVRLSPDNPYAHYFRASALTWLGQPSAASIELYKGRAIVLKNPLQAADAKYFDVALRALGYF